jgi:hypothetical protein
MATNAKNTFGSELWIAASGGALVKVAELMDIGQPSFARNSQDATTHESPGGWMERIGDGVIETGQITFEGHYIPLSAGDTAIRGFMVSGELIDYEIRMKGTSASGKVAHDGSGYLVAYTPNSLPVRGKQTFNGAIDPTGVIGQAAVPA